MLFAQAFFQLPLRRLILLTTNPSVDVLPSLAAIAAAITAISSSSEVSSSSSTGAATTGAAAGALQAVCSSWKTFPESAG